MKKMYLLSMSGGGDLDFRLVDKETWDWIHFRSPNEPIVPDIVKQNLFKACYVTSSFPDDPKRWEDVDLKVEEGSYNTDNDRMLVAYGHIDGQNCQFFSVRELNKFIKDHDIEVVEEMEGYIY